MTDQMPRIGFHSRGATLQESAENAGRLEAAGADSVWVGEAFNDSFVHCMALAAATSTIKLGTCVSLLTRSPVTTMQACTGIDEFSGGRFTLGLGVGPSDRNRKWHSLNADRPARRMREFVQCFKAAWNSGPGEPANVEGDAYWLEGFQRVRRSPSANLPVLLGVVGPLNTRLGVELADGVLFDVCLARSYVDSIGMPAIEEGLRRAGKRRDEVTIGGLFAVSVDPDEREAVRRARHSILAHIDVHYYIPTFEAAGFGAEALTSRTAFAAGDIPRALDAISDDMVRALCVAGTPDQVRAQCAHWGEVVDLMVVSAPGMHLPPDESRFAYDQALDALTP